MVGRTSEFHHLPHILWPLEAEAIDEEQRLLDSSLQDISVDGDHPAVQCNATAARRERVEERGREGKQRVVGEGGEREREGETGRWKGERRKRR